MLFLLTSTTTGDYGRFGYNNLLLNAASVTSTSEATGYYDDNAAEWPLHDKWKPASAGTNYLTYLFSSAQQFDCFGISAHTMADEGTTVTFQYTTDSGSTWTDVDSVTPSDGKFIFNTFTQLSANGVRYKFVGGAPEIGHVFAGAYLELPVGMRIGFVPITMGNDDDYSHNTSDNGLYLGSNLVRRACKSSIELTLMTPAWVRSYLVPFLEHARQYPFYWAWNKQDYPTEIGYCWCEQKIPAPNYSHAKFMSCNIPISGLVEL